MTYSFDGLIRDSEWEHWRADEQQDEGAEQSKADLIAIKDFALGFAQRLGSVVSVQGGGFANPDRNPKGRDHRDTINISFANLPVTFPDPDPSEA